MKRLVLGFSSLSLILGLTGQAWAGPILGTVYLNTTAAVNAVNNNPAASVNSGSAQFNAGAINYSQLGSGAGGTVGAFLNNPAFFNTTGAFSSGAQLTDGSFAHGTYLQLVGTTFLNSGANSFDILHDDGFQLTFSGPVVVTGASSAPGLSSPTHSTGNLQTTAAGEYSFILSYGEAAGLPANLTFSVNEHIVTGVPEPSTMIAGGLGILTTLGWNWNRRRQAKVAA